MYVKRIQIINYGPIDRLDITFPFDGLISAKNLIYPDTPEVEEGKVYKIRSGFYIKSKKEFYFARVDFQDNLFIEEIRSAHPKEAYPNPPEELTGHEAQAAWGKKGFNRHYVLIGVWIITSVFRYLHVSIGELISQFTHFSHASSKNDSLYHHTARGAYQQANRVVLSLFLPSRCVSRDIVDGRE